MWIERTAAQKPKKQSHKQMAVAELDEKVDTTKRSILLLLTINYKLAWAGTGLKEMKAFFVRATRKDV